MPIEKGCYEKPFTAPLNEVGEKRPKQYLAINEQLQRLEEVSLREK